MNELRHQKHHKQEQADPGGLEEESAEPRRLGLGLGRCERVGDCRGFSSSKSTLTLASIVPSVRIASPKCGWKNPPVRCERTTPRS